MPLFGTTGQAASGAGGAPPPTPDTQGPLVGYTAPPTESHPFIDWSSPGSVVSAAWRAPLGIARQATHLTESAGKGLLGLPVAAAKEVYNEARPWGAVGADIGHGDFGDIGHDSLHAFAPVAWADRAQAIEARLKKEGKPHGVGEVLAELGKTYPLTAGIASSFQHTGTDVEQVTRAGLNTVGSKFGREPGGDVGQLGEGAGLLGKTDLARSAKKGGGGVGGKLVEDAANLSIVGGVAKAALGHALTGATAEVTAREAAAAEAEKAATEATKATQDSLSEAQKRADVAAKQVEQIGQAVGAGQGYDPHIAAQWQQATMEQTAAQESLREAQQFADKAAAGPEATAAQEARAAADAAKAHADKIKGYHEATGHALNLGLKAANSPFAPLFGTETIPGAFQLGGRAAKALVGKSEFLDAAAQRIQQAGETIAEHAQQRHLVRNEREQMQLEQREYATSVERAMGQVEQQLPVDEQTVGRGPLGMFGTKTKTVAHEEAQAVAIMAQTGEGDILGQLQQRLPADQAIEVFRRNNPNAYTDEQLALAADVWKPGGPATDLGVRVHDAIALVREKYGEPGGAQDLQAQRYLALQGEATAPLVRPHAGPGAFEQAQHNVFGDEPRTEGLAQRHKAEAKYATDVKRGERAVEKAGKKLISATSRRDALGLSEAERSSSRALLARVLEAPTARARQLASEPGTFAQLAQAPERVLSRIGKQVEAGKLTPEAAIPKLADAIVALNAKNPGTLSEQAQAIVTHGGEPVLPRTGIPRVAQATEPAVIAGRGIERGARAAQLTEQGTRELVRSQVLYGKAMERLTGETRIPSARVQRAAANLIKSGRRLEALQSKVRDALARTAEHEGSDLFGQAGLTRKQVADTVRDVRRQVKAMLKAEAADIDAEMHRMGIHRLKWGRTDEEIAAGTGQEQRRVMVRKGEQKGRDVIRNVRKGVEGGDAQAIAESGLTGGKFGTRYFGPDGMEGDELLTTWRGARGLASQSMGAEEHELNIEAWLDKVRTIKNLEAAASTGIERGWEPGRLGASSDVRGQIMGALNDVYGPELARDLAPKFMHGDPNAIAEDVVGKIADHLGRERSIDARLEPGADVATALEADRQRAEGGLTGAPPGRASLDAAGRALYDEQVALGQAGTQGHIVAQREAQATRVAQDTAEGARAQGAAEGRLLGRSEAQEAAGERQLAQGERLGQSAARIVAHEPELRQEAAARSAGPLTALYRKVGGKEVTVEAAAAEYVKAQRALERLDTKLADKLQKLSESVEAQPRPNRPVLELGERIHDELLPLAKEADKEYGPAGTAAGDVLRAVAADMTSSLADAVRQGSVEPQYVQGTRSIAGTDYGNAAARSGGPVVADTGYRRGGIGLQHPTGYQQLTRKVIARGEQVAENEAGNRIRDTFGGTLRDELVAKGLPVEAVEKLSRVELAQAMKDHDLAAWNLSDRAGRMIQGSKLDLETPVVPRYVWKQWQRWQTPAQREGAAGAFLNAYDKTTRTLKKLIRLSPRWQVAVTTGHSIMAMVGGGFDPLTYAHDLDVALHLNKMFRAGEMTAEDHAWVAQQTPAVQEALARHGGFVPGQIVRRGFAREDFLLPTQAERDLVGGRGQKVQTFLDDMHRTAVWVGQLDKGLNERGLADFRAQFPDLAHLTDAEIRDEAAIRLSIRTMGDYLNQTTAERGVIGRIVFFYPWLKHITKLTLNTAIHNPLRVVWLLHLGAMFSNGDQAPPLGWLGGSWDAGNNRWITPPNYNPFTHALGGVVDNPLGGLNPILKTGVAALTGRNLGTGKDVSRPPGQSGPLSPGQLFNFAANQVPLVKAAREAGPALVGRGQPVVRYQTGEPIFFGGQPLPSNEDQFLGTNRLVPGAVAPLMPLLGLPRQLKVNTDEILAAQVRRQAKTAATRRRYAALLARSGG